MGNDKNNSYLEWNLRKKYIKFNPLWVYPFQLL